MPSLDPCSLPPVIQGGMGVAVSSWRLARSVAAAGQLGVVSGTALDLVLSRRLQDGDQDAVAALAHFPFPEVAERILARYHRPEGRTPGQPYTPAPRLSVRPSKSAQELAVAGNFVEVWLAKRGHDGVVGVNYLEKVQMATPAAAYGALLAGVDVVLMGAGIPRDIPRLLDDLAAGGRASLPVSVIGAEDDAYTVDFDPEAIFGADRPELRRPVFLAIVSAHVLAAYLARDEQIRPDGFVIEGHHAGGHNAPPRGRPVLDELGEPVYGPRDLPDLSAVQRIGLPFWVAGAAGTPEQIDAARGQGAHGVQVGTVFALSSDSGLEPHVRQGLLEGLREGTLRVRTDPVASPTGFPFKVVELPGTVAQSDVYEARPRLCDLGYLRSPYLRDNGAIGYRCAAEPVHVFVRKGGDEAETEGRLCLCNGLMADVGLGQTRSDGYAEPMLVTLGSELTGARELAAKYPDGWSAADVIDWLVG